MKLLIISLLISTYAHANLENCFKDADSHGSNVHAVSPEKSCYEQIKNHPQKIEIKSSDGKLHLFALKKMFYADHFEDGKFVQRKLMAGEQPGLKNILDISLNEQKKKIIVLQKDSVSTFGFELIGNVVPSSKYISNYISSVNKVLLLDNEDVLALFKNSGFRLINSDAESRYETPNSKPKIIFDFDSDENQFTNVKSALYLKDKNIVIVLDEKSVKIFRTNILSKVPSQTFNIENGKSLILREKEVFIIKTNEELLKIPVVY